MDNFLEQFNDINTEQTFVPQEVEKNKPLAIIAYIIPILFFLPICGDKNSTYCKFHSNQCLTWLITLIVMSVVRVILAFIPVLGVILNLVIWLAILAVLIVFIIGAVKGKAYRIPVVGNLLNVF
ncbi:MAG: DUF4870 domain-containing protein [Ruminococcus sp.]|nr:DUF4870 domain-containing protein [Ruminococcus sp.]